MSGRPGPAEDRSGPTVGLVAGGGQFPILCAGAVRRQGGRVVAAAHRGETEASIEEAADVCRWFYLGQLGKIMGFFKKQGVEEVVFAGTITKKRIFFDVRPDLRAISIWRRMRSRLDDSILRAVASELEAEGFRVVSATEYMGEIVTPRGVLTRKSPSKAQWDDIRFGWRLAKEIGALDIGQCVVVKDKAVLAVEAIEGTDETIKRGAALAGGGAVVVKVCKPGQDTRFDLPSLGLKTVETMTESGAEVLAVEAGASLFFDMEEAVALADKKGITIVGIDEKELSD